MLSLDAKEWKELQGGYRLRYDASVPLRLLESGSEPDEKIWDELWGNLYHQGDVGIASYAAVPQVFRIYQSKGWLDYHLPNLARSVEEARRKDDNPDVPDWLRSDYEAALKEIVRYCLDRASEQSDKNFARALLLLIAILLNEEGVYDLLDFVQIGDEARALQLYQDFG
jgi:hypothetical protein